MPTFGALNCPAIEQCVALMTCAAHPLRNWFVGYLLAGGRGGYGQRLEVQGGVSDGRGGGPCRDNGTSCSSSTSYTLSLVLLGLFGGVAWAFPAPVVVAVAADLVRAEGGLASVAYPVDSHADLLLDPLCVGLDGRRPLAGF